MNRKKGGSPDYVAYEVFADNAPDVNNQVIIPPVVHGRTFDRVYGRVITIVPENQRASVRSAISDITRSQLAAGIPEEEVVMEVRNIITTLVKPKKVKSAKKKMKPKVKSAKKKSTKKSK